MICLSEGLIADTIPNVQRRALNEDLIYKFEEVQRNHKGSCSNLVRARYLPWSRYGEFPITRERELCKTGGPESDCQADIQRKFQEFQGVWGQRSGLIFFPSPALTEVLIS